MEEALELLERQLLEIEALQSMYPEESEFEMDERTLAQAQACHEAGCVAEGALSYCICTEVEGEAPTVERQLSLHVVYPAMYPTVPPRLTVQCRGLPRAAAAAITASVGAVAAERCQGEDGEECVMEVLMQAQELAAEALAARVSEKEAEAEAEDADLEEAVVRIDHMNDSAGYMRKLKKWSTQLSLGARVFYQETVGSSRVEGVMLALQGEPDDVSSFLQRLRTEYVDVDKSGAKCKERKSTTLCRRPNGQHKEGEIPTPLFSGFEATAYAGAEALEAKMAQLSLLHVGEARQRFGGDKTVAAPEPESACVPAPRKHERPKGKAAGGAPTATVLAAACAPPCLSFRDGELRLSVFVRPGRPCSEVTNKAAALEACSDDELHVDLAAQPRENAANKELVALLAKLLKITKADASVVLGEKNRHKSVAIKRLSPTEALERLLAAA